MGTNDAGYEAKVDYTVREGDRPSFVSATGRVTRIPGDYQFRMALFAEVPGHIDPHQFEHTVPVHVAAASTSTD
jgi:hypothetical protein